ncbi:MAG TPA: helix-turn-helix domain-containing GNAT family N-acetyltransferase [Synergistales bacterium]|jgi:DNA-binding MarR family transcriptional regulator/GNAT superfamily N-acetyltransferase|nr:helix-turn-helix domain-containing GNAT family N-acetyltransferase [Synergistales bacterium]MDI9393201.1 helix-turn-helix domain-containing GNAT family N-acetyltransferase [Synergistota bacterium]MDY0179271.1 helix-turn-helix domain-containing GNAT family N-acetyltransferase [Synergistaceae bacterium]MDD3134519.1 helix-turn-helix domain-containing GNAT family N-acetyltransferase [Synergistales bacterium]MDD3830732.1 helix-turn-helix domain-containing GNAT family N-acetyltransferase [Synergis
MDRNSEEFVAEIRDFNRFYTNFIGLVNRNILKSPYSLAEVRVLLEIDAAGRCTARDLTRKLDIDPGYLSRMLSRFTKNGLVEGSVSPSDGRAKILSLTDKGRDTFRQVSSESSRQVASILGELPEKDWLRLINSMRSIRSILSHGNNREISIRTHRIGDLGYIIYRHAVLYQEEYGLGPVFEDYLLEGFLAFSRSEQPGTIWIAEDGDQIVGSIAIAGIDSETAQLRWFLIEPEYRGVGLGRRLMTVAMDHCRDKGYRKVFLWTFSDLHAARHLYKEYGFQITEEHPNDSWKPGIVEERWDISLE